MTLAPPATDLADRFALIIRRLLEVIGMQSIGNAMAGPLILLLGSRINALGKRFACLAEQVRAGTLPPPRVRGAARLSRASGPRLAVPRRPFPNAFGWLYRVVKVQRHDAAWCGLQIERLLREPEMAALVEAAPQQMGRILRPLCWMLKVDARGVLPPLPKRSRKRDREASRHGPDPQPEGRRVEPPAVLGRTKAGPPPAWRPSRPEGLTDKYSRLSDKELDDLIRTARALQQA